MSEKFQIAPYVSLFGSNGFPGDVIKRPRNRKRGREQKGEGETIQHRKNGKEREIAPSAYNGTSYPRRTACID
jgi:hypothetical protein